MSKSTALSIRLDKTLKQDLIKEAQKEGRSISNYIIFILNNRKTK